jgi:hypothetical protein
MLRKTRVYNIVACSPVISNYATAVIRHRPVNTNTGAVFSLWSVPRCYKQDKLDNRWGSAVVSCCCEKLVAKAGDSSGNQRKGTIHR